MYRGSPCWGPPVCPPMRRQDGIGGKAPTRACVVVCLCVVLRVKSTRLIDRDRHWIMSPLRRCMPPRHKRYVILPIHTDDAVHARVVSMPCLAYAFCSCIRGSVFCTAHVSHLHVPMRRVSCALSRAGYPCPISTLIPHSFAELQLPS